MISLQEALSLIETKPEVRHIVSISGGKDSAALAVYLHTHYPQIPAEYVFCDTGVELDETYSFLEKLECVLGAKINRVNALQLFGVKEKPGRTAFDWVLQERYGGFLPNPRMRWCTRVLKIQPFEHYVGDSEAVSYIGIRADEDREGYQSNRKPPAISSRQNIMPVYPFKDDGIRIDGVKEILEDSGVGFPSYYQWRSRSGCFFCFYQQLGEWQGLMKQHPNLFAAAKAYERRDGVKQFTWTAGRSLEELESDPKCYPVQGADETDGCSLCHL